MGWPANRIGQRGRHHLRHVEPAPVDGHAGEQRPPDAAVEGVNLGLGGAVQQHGAGRAAPDLGQSVEQVAVDRRAHPQGEQAGVGIQRALDLGQDRLLVADEAVGDDAHHPEPAGSRRPGQRHSHGRQERAVTGCLQLVDPGPGPGAVAGGGEQRCGAQLDRGVRHPHQPDAVVGAELGDRPAHGPPGQGQGLAGHRGRGVDHEHQLARPHVGRARRGRRLDQQREAAAGAAGVPVGQEGGDRRAPGQPVAQHEVLVGDAILAHQGHAHRGGAAGLLGGGAPVNRDRVGGAVDRGHGPAGIDVNLQGDGAAAALPGRQGRRRDPRGVGHLVGVGRGAVAAGWTGHRGAGDVARPHHHGIDELVGAVSVVERHVVGDGDLDHRAGGDVDHRLGEDVGPLLFQEGGDAAALAGPAVGSHRLRAARDVALDGAAPDGDVEGADRGVVGQREHVDGLERPIERVVEGLVDGDLGDEAQDVRRDPGAGERQAISRAAMRGGAGAGAGGDDQDALARRPHLGGRGSRWPAQQRRGGGQPGKDGANGRDHGRAAHDRLLTRDPGPPVCPLLTSFSRRSRPGKSE